MPPKKAGLKPTTIQQAIQRWEEKTGENAAEATDIGFQFQRPPIEVMDNNLRILKKCVKLSLSTNRIEKIAGLGELKNLRQLSLARNRITSIKGLEAVKDTLERIFLSYNSIKSLAGIENFKKLNCIFIMHNQLDMAEVGRLEKMETQFKEICLWGNPACGKISYDDWKEIMLKKFPSVTYIEGESRFLIKSDELMKLTGGRALEPTFTPSQEKLLVEVMNIYGIPTWNDEKKEKN